jgi:hypothetical protein
VVGMNDGVCRGGGGGARKGVLGTVLAGVAPAPRLRSSSSRSMIPTTPNINPLLKHMPAICGMEPLNNPATPSHSIVFRRQSIEFENCDPIPPCIRTRTVSNGCPTTAAITPAVPPETTSLHGSGVRGWDAPIVSPMTRTTNSHYTHTPPPATLLQARVLSINLSPYNPNLAKKQSRVSFFEWR